MFRLPQASRWSSGPGSGPCLGSPSKGIATALIRPKLSQVALGRCCTLKIARRAFVMLKGSGRSLLKRMFRRSHEIDLYTVDPFHTPTPKRRTFSIFPSPSTKSCLLFRYSLQPNHSAFALPSALLSPAIQTHSPFPHQSKPLPKRLRRRTLAHSWPSTSCCRCALRRRFSPSSPLA